MFYACQIINLTNFAVVSGVGIKRVDFILLFFLMYLRPDNKMYREYAVIYTTLLSFLSYEEFQYKPDSVLRSLMCSLSSKANVLILCFILSKFRQENDISICSVLITLL